MKPSKHAASFAMLAAAYPRWEVDEAVAAVWLAELEPYAEQAVSAELRRWLRTQTWPPSVAEILRSLHAIPSAEDAWAQVVASMARDTTTSFRRFHGSNLATEAARAVWPDGWLPEGALRQRREFIDAYGRLASVTLEEARAVPLIKA